MAKLIQTAQEFNTILKQDQPVLIDFYADWCGPCQMQLPVVEQLSDKYGDELQVLKVNVDTLPEIAQTYQVRSIPALFIVRDGQIQDKMVGYQSLAALEGRLERLRVTA